MRTRCRRVASLALLLVVAALADPLEAAAPRVSVLVEVRAELAPITRDLLEQEADAIFRPAGVEFDWGGGAEAPIHLTIATRPDVPVISGCSRGLHDHRLAMARPGPVAGTGRVILWVEQVARAVSGEWDRPGPTRLSEEILARALGRALAHELTHLLLGERAHRDRGILKASLSRHDLIGKPPGLRLSREEMARLSGLGR